MTYVTNSDVVIVTSQTEYGPVTWVAVAVSVETYKYDLSRSQKWRRTTVGNHWFGVLLY